MTTATTEKRQYRMRVRARRSEETAARIRAVALDLFTSRPYDEVTLAEIAAGAGVTVPTLIAHFGRKEDLFVAACKDGVADVVGIRADVLVGDHAAVVRNLFNSYEAFGDRILHLLSEEDRFPAVRAITDKGRRYHRTWVERVFEPSLASLPAARREQLVVQFVLATDLSAWKLLRRDMKLPRRSAEAVIAQTIEALAGGA